jgi:hypothetical protein
MVSKNFEGKSGLEYDLEMKEIESEKSNGIAQLYAKHLLSGLETRSDEGNISKTTGIKR